MRLCSGCSNPIVAESISKAKEDIKEGDPKMALDDLTDAIRKEALASANIGQIDETIQLAIQKQKELLANHTDEVQKDKSSKGFTTSVTGLNNVVLESNVAFWGLESISRAEAIDAVQKSMDDTLYLLADNLIDQKFTFHELENICNSFLLCIFTYYYPLYIYITYILHIFMQPFHA